MNQKVREIVDVLDFHRSPIKDDEAIRKIKSITFAIKNGIDYPGVDEKCDEILNWASIYYSHRKHEKYASPDLVRSFITQSCSSLSRLLDRAGETRT